ncbi:protein O-mannosyl-transferase 2-like [Macrobrachium rosenbergii]|uniref:protein O-mannosyl-transferase 2-like n=1 Tax=Macrobrachium rosenbergii TaxID=79674 RepID=UPI0034D5B932
MPHEDTSSRVEDALAQNSKPRHDQSTRPINEMGPSWDEVHFGTFANHYINRTFIHDVHPPLGKMLIAGIAKLTGYRASFDFQAGNVYSSDFNYVAVRSMIAILGASLVPLSFLVVWEISFNLNACVIASVCVLSDTFVHRLNTLILLDPPLMVAIVASVYSTIKFHNMRDREWSKAWWGWMLLTGFCLGIVTSIKYVGVFTVLFVGLHTAYQLFCISVDNQRPMWHVLPHTLARAGSLILLPIIVYLSTFVVHFWILTDWSVNGGGFYPTKFFASFKNTEYDNATMPEHIHYGANITIQNTRPLCGYLESWFDLFPSDYTAPCQQVTSSTMRDPEALMWTIKKVDLEAGAVLDGRDPNEAPILVRNGDYVMLTHAETGRSLRSHSHKAPLTKRHFQVCGYGDDGAGGPFETWQLIIPDAEKGEPLTIISQDFMLKHYKMNCYLHVSEKAVLPKAWAFNGAKEVTCTKNQYSTGLRWHVNWNISPKLNSTAITKDKTLGLWGKIYEQHLDMFIGNSVLVSTSEEMERSARPWMWPLAWQVQTMGSYKVNHTNEYEHFAIGMTNPYLTYVNILCLVGVVLLAAVHSYRAKRYQDEAKESVECRRKALESCSWLLICWAIHYVPFFFMSRVLYYHHYCPSYIFSCMITGIIIAWACESASKRFAEKHRDRVLQCFLLLPTIAVVASYVLFFPLATYIKGNHFERHETLGPLLDKVYFGQMWPEFGYRKEEFSVISKTEVLSWDEGLTMEHPHINATLYYTTPLKNTKTKNSTNAIAPWAASNFSSWVPGDGTDANIPYLPWWQEEVLNKASEANNTEEAPSQDEDLSKLGEPSSESYSGEGQKAEKQG